jgi:hypothetical protein
VFQANVRWADEKDRHSEPLSSRPKWVSMAKGNLGNLLQHFVALEAVRSLVAVSPRVAYVDLFAMAPWEAVARPEKPFLRLIATLPHRPTDRFASALSATFEQRPHATKHEYPNTLLLALAAGARFTHITLCEIEAAKRAALEEFLIIKSLPHTLHGDCTAERLAGCVDAALVVMDPFQVVADPKTRNKPGYISIARIRGALGQIQLNVLGRPKASSPAPPCVAVIFSYSEPKAKADATDRALRSMLANDWGWSVARVVEPTTLRVGQQRPALHQAWWCASDDRVAAPPDLQDQWKRWKAFAP